jgi:hypothetical protein
VPPLPAAVLPTSTSYHPRQRNMSSATLSYPHNELTALVGPPTADNLRVMIDELVANTSAITTSLGGGQHGHSGLVLTATAYAALTTPAPTPFIVPAPPATPTLATMAALVAADANITPSIQMMLYELEKATVDTAVRVETDMRRMVIAAVPPIYLEAFAASTGKAIGQCSVRSMLDHLVATYGIVRAPEVAKEMAKLQSSFNPAEPIEKYWATINGVVAFVTKHRTKPDDTTVIEEILSSFERDGHFRDEVKEWRLKPEAQHILTEFIAAITKVHHLATITAGKAGYHGANAAAAASPTATAAAASSMPVTPPRKPAPAGNTTIIDADNQSKPLTVCYCSVHGMQNANAIKRGGTAHSNKDCPDKTTNAKWIDGATLLDRRGGSNTFVFGRQNPAKDK